MPSRALQRILVVACVAAGVAAWIALERGAPPVQREPRVPAPVLLEGAPRVSLSADRVSFGTRFDDEETTVRIAIANTGSLPLHVERIVTNCGCFRVNETPPEIAPGAAATAVLGVRLAGQSGPLERAVAIHTDDPAALVTHVNVSGEVRPRLVTSPAEVTLRPAAHDARSSIDVAVTSGDGAPLDGVTALSLTSGVTATAERSADGLRVRLDAAPFAEDFTGSFVLRRGAYERVVAVTGFAYRDVRVAPERIDLGVIRAATTAKARLVTANGVAWTVAGVTPNRPEVTAAVVGETLEVRVDGAAPPGTFAALVTIRLEGARPSVLQVPVTGFVER